MKVRNIKLATVLLSMLLVVIFCIGNRYGLLLEYYSNTDMNQLLVPIEALSSFFESYESAFLGLKIGFTNFPLLSGIAFVGMAIIGYIWGMQLRTNYREGEEHGSARYGSLEEEAGSLVDEVDENNMIFSENVKISMNTRKTFLNNNVMVIGGSGSGKTRFNVKPNILQMNCNYIVTDPKGSLLIETGNAFKEYGYDIKVLNLVDMSKSMGYNPFDYINKPNDVLKFINNLIASTSAENGKSGGDDFFVKSEIALLTALCFYMLAMGRKDEINMGMLMELIDDAEASEDDENMESQLDLLFEELKADNEVLTKIQGNSAKNSYSYLAVRQYNLYKKAAGKTAKSILISVGVRMAVFNIPELDNLMRRDELDLRSFGSPSDLYIDGKLQKDKDGNPIKRKTVLFCIISDSDSTFTFLASILYQQLYDMLYMMADDLGGRLPIHTRFIQDEFANTGKQKDFEVKIATMRSREISVCIILQNLAQLKNLYKDSWETIFGNCDTTLFLGGKEPSTLEYISKLIGNTTIDHLSISENRGGSNSGTYSRSNQLISRALISADEIGRLGTDECLVHVRGKHIFRDKKYDLMKHKNIDFTTDAHDKETAKKNMYEINVSIHDVNTVSFQQGKEIVFHDENMERI